jgi:hypothetical protein
MRRHTIVRTGLFSFAAGAVLVFGGVAEPASASPSAVVPGLATDCDVSGGQPGGEHAPGGHDSHGTAGETSPPADGEMDHSMPMEDGEMDHSMPMEDGEMDHSMPMEDGGMEHGSHGAGATVEGPSDGTRTAVLTGFSVLNGAALGGAAFLRRRTSSRRGRHLAARAAARPASARPNGSDLDGEQR